MGTYIGFSSSVGATHGALLNQIFTDDFNREDGDLANGWLYNGSWLISDGKLIATPATEGTNKLTNGDFETGNPPTGWVAAASNFIAQDADVRTGSVGLASAKVTVGGSNYAVSRQITGTAGRFYEIDFWGKKTTAAKYGYEWVRATYFNNTDWINNKGRVQLNANVLSIYLLGDTGVFYVDDIIVKQLTTNQVFCVRETKESNIDISVDITNSGRDYAGIVLCVDSVATPTDYILIGVDPVDTSATANTAYLRVSKVVGGVYTELLVRGVSLFDISTLRVVKNGKALKVYLGNEQAFDDFIVEDLGLINNTLHGLFSTGNTATFNNYSETKYKSGIISGAPIFTRVSQANLFTTSGTKDWLGWPQLIKAADGTWIMTYVASTGHTDLDYTTVIHIRFSNDEGATWTNEDTYIGGGAVTGFPMTAHEANVRTLGGLLIVCPNNDLLFHEYEMYKGTYQWRSTDNGATWIDEGKIQNDIRFISLDDYCIDGTDIYIIVNYTDDIEPWINRLYKSTNNGETWVMVSQFETDGDECGLVIAPNGNMIVVMRDKAKLTTYQFTSTDKGLTWGAKISRPDLDVIQRPRLSLDGNGGVLMMARDLLDPVTLVQYNAVFYSNDNCVTWGRKFYPDVSSSTDGNYSGYIIKADGSYYMITYKGSYNAAVIRRLLFTKA